MAHYESYKIYCGILRCKARGATGSAAHVAARGAVRGIQLCDAVAVRLAVCDSRVVAYQMIGRLGVSRQLWCSRVPASYHV